MMICIQWPDKRRLVEVILSNDGPFDYVFYQSGGGGMAAGASSWLKVHHPLTKVSGWKVLGSQYGGILGTWRACDFA